MRAAEIITIYLAAAAPVAVACFLRRRAHTSITRAAASYGLARDIAHAALIGLLFPYTLASRALTRLHRAAVTASTSSPAAAHAAKLDAARKSLVAALHNFEDRARELNGRRTDAAVVAAHALKSNVERYAGLTLALAEVEPDGEPAAHETELARVAGRAGDDLEIAGRCVRRRNLSRLREHQAQSRLELLHALAGLQDTLEHSDHAATRARRVAHNLAHDPSRASSQQLAAVLLRVYERAFDLFMLHEDARGVQSLVRLLDATRARLYRHHEPDAARASHAPREDATGELSCTPHRPQAHASPLSTPTIPISARG
jgi:hypothetical protein